MNTNNEAEEAREAREVDGKEFVLDDKLIAPISLSEDELKLLIEELDDIRQTKQTFNQKLNKKLETLESNNAD